MSKVSEAKGDTQTNEVVHTRAARRRAAEDCDCGDEEESKKQRPCVCFALSHSTNRSGSYVSVSKLLPVINHSDHLLIVFLCDFCGAWRPFLQLLTIYSFFTLFLGGGDFLPLFFAIRALG